MRAVKLLITAIALVPASCAAPPSTVASEQVNSLRQPDVPYEPSSPRVVAQMLRMAGVTSKDVVYDLGSGDGRIPITAARDFGARGVGIEIDPALIARARENAKQAGVERRVTFRNEDLFEADFSEATVVTLFLWPEINIKLRPKLLATLKPGTRIVSHWHDMDEWQPEQTVRINNVPIYLWRIPPGGALPANKPQ